MKIKQLKSYLLSLLARREYSEWELRQKLTKFTTDDQLITDLLNEFKCQNWQSDQRFTESLINSSKTKYGQLKILHQLKNKGINTELDDITLPSIAEQTEVAITLLQKKYKQAEESLTAKQKYFQFLRYRGFQQEVIYQAIDSWLNNNLQ